MVPVHIGAFPGRNCRHPEPTVSGWQAFAAALALTLFVGGGLMMILALVE